MTGSARRGAVLLLVLAGCGGGLPVDPNPFTNPQSVSIEGYGGVAMEPALSPDGQTLFFNDSNAATVDTDLHWATLDAARPGGLHFTYGGQVAAANSNVLDGVPSLDQAGNLYFISTRAYGSTHLYTVHRGQYAAGAVSGVEEVPGLESKGVGWLIFDAFISADGTQLWFAEGDFSSGALGAADLGLAVRQPSGAFLRADPSALFREVNILHGAQYAPAVSADGLELFFTRLTGTGTTTAIYRSRRPNTASPWGAPAPIDALVGGVIEAAAPTADGKSLYFHRWTGAGFELARVTRR